MDAPEPAPDLTRGRFLAALSWLLAGACAAVLGGTGAAYFVSPAFKKEEEEWVDAGAADSVPRGRPVKIDFVERKRDAWVVNERRSSAWVSTEDGKTFTVFDPRCTHLGCPYSWNEEKKLFLCPCHAGVFDGEGRVVSGPPPRPLDRYRAEVRAGRLMIKPLAQRALA